MKEPQELTLPEELRYAEDHEWIREEGETVRIGISDYAQDQLGDVVYVELPQVGAVFSRGAVFGTVESVKAVSELIMPVGGEILEVNAELQDAPERVNESPYGDGWMVRARPSQAEELGSLLSSEAYLDLLRKGP